MGIEVTINGITGQSPFNIYVCQPDGSGCFYINTITTDTYSFEIPAPYDYSTEYMLKIVDDNECIISGTSIVS